MTLTFLTNYLTHHQIPFCEEMAQRLGDGFHLLLTNRMEEERIRMGWAVDVRRYPYCRYFDEDTAEGDRLVEGSDVVICGGADDYFLRNRLAAGGVTFRYYERLYKKGRIHAFSPRGYLRKLRQHTRYRKQRVYLLCAGAYVPADFSLFGAYPGKMVKWGYFPAFVPCGPRGNESAGAGESVEADTDGLELLWTGRMLGWKHPEHAVLALDMLRRTGLRCHLTMIGEGERRGAVESLVADRGLEEDVRLLPFLSPEEVREWMCASDIYLMTSDYEEGWGAVVNEAMNAGCAVVASHAAGSVPYLIRHGENGLIYHYHRTERRTLQALQDDVRVLCEDGALRRRLQEAAYQTIADTWNASVAAERFLRYAEAALAGEDMPRWAEGPMSAAEVISPGGGGRADRICL